MRTEKYHLLTRDEIVEKLKTMVVGEEKELPVKHMFCIHINKEYNPEDFSQKIEDSEEKIDVLSEISKEIKKPYFNFIWNNTLCNIPRNSEQWRNNHSKICELAVSPCVWAQCIVHEDGRRDYYSEDLVDKIVRWGEIHGGIVDIS